MKISPLFYGISIATAPTYEMDTTGDSVKTTYRAREAETREFPMISAGASFRASILITKDAVEPAKARRAWPELPKLREGVMNNWFKEWHGDDTEAKYDMPDLVDIIISDRNRE